MKEGRGGGERVRVLISVSKGACSLHKFVPVISSMLLFTGQLSPELRSGLGFIKMLNPDIVTSTSNSFWCF